MCIKMMEQPNSATVGSIFGSIWPADTSLTMFAPAETAAWATEARYVSIEMAILSKAGWERMNSIDGRTRDSSSAAVT